MYFDDTLHAGIDKYSEYCKKPERMFMWKTCEWEQLQFAGFDIKTKENVFQIHHKRYIFKLKKLAFESS